MVRVPADRVPPRPQHRAHDQHFENPASRTRALGFSLSWDRTSLWWYPCSGSLCRRQGIEDDREVRDHGLGRTRTEPRALVDRNEARDRLVHNVIGQVSEGVKEPVLSRVFEYWRNIDPDLGKAIEEGVRANLDQ